MMFSQPQKSMVPRVLAASLIVLAGWAAYSHSFHGPFIFDDPASIPDNSTIWRLWPIGPVLSPPRGGETVSGRPMLNLSFAINYALGGTEVWGYHITNLAIHLFNGLLLLGILRRTFLLPALQPRFGRSALPLASAIALLWVVHPLQTESVTYLVQRAESLASLFYLLVLYAVIRGAMAGTIWYIVAVVACWLGVATKEIVVTAPIIVLLYDRAFLAGSFRQAWRQRWRLYLGLATAWLLMAALMITIGGRADTAGFGHGMTSWEYAATQGGAILRYVRLALWPTGLCLDYGDAVARTTAEILPGALFVLILVGMTVWAWRRCPELGFLGFFFLIVLAPSSSFVPIVFQTMAEHRMYLPLAAIITLLVIGAYLASQKWPVRGRSAIGLCLVISIALAFGILTFQRNQDYRSELSIWEDTVTKIPNNSGAHYSWGSALLKLGRFSEAIEHFDQAVRLDPNYGDAHNNWGSALASLGRFAEAMKHFERATQLEPNNATYYCSASGSLLNLKRPQEAIDSCTKALKLRPNYAEAHYNWGNALLAMNRPAEAIKHFEQAVQLKPNDADAHNNLGMAQSKLGRWSEAIEQYQQSLKILPEFVPAHFNLALALLHTGRLDQAIQSGLETARLMPDNLQIHQSVAWLMAIHESAEEGNGAEAVKLAQRACELAQWKDAVCLDTLAAAYASAGRFAEAITSAKEALQLAKAAGQNSLAQEIFTRLQLYRDGKPYREP